MVFLPAASPNSQLPPSLVGAEILPGEGGPIVQAAALLKSKSLYSIWVVSTHIQQLVK